MKALSIGRASLILVGALVNACGEVPEEAGEPRELLSTRQALACEGDTTPPELSISEQEFLYECTGFDLGNTWEAPVVIAEDACEGPTPVYKYNTGDDDGDGVPGSSDPDDFGPGPTTEVEGHYYSYYMTWDSSQNWWGVTVAVHVRDTLKPVLYLNADNDGGDPAYEQVECLMPGAGPFPQNPTPYVAPGASAADQCYGNLNHRIFTIGQVNPQIPGTYTVEYRVSDDAANEAVPVSRTVEVVDTYSPELMQQPPIKVWPGTGWMRKVLLSECAQTLDMCEGNMDINQKGFISHITSNDPETDATDTAILDNSTFEVRAELNSSGATRVYTAHYTVTDSAGNSRPGTCTVYVPLNSDAPAP